MLPAVGEVDSIVDTPGSTWLLKIHVFPQIGVRTRSAYQARQSGQAVRPGSQAGRPQARPLAGLRQPCSSWSGIRYQLLVPAGLRKRVLEETHDGLCGGHPGEEITFQKLNSHTIGLAIGIRSEIGAERVLHVPATRPQHLRTRLLPEKLHSDQGRQFESEIVKQLCRLLKIEKSMTTPYHPQSDGFVERFNRTLLNLLSTSSGQHPSEWDTSLHKACVAYHTSVQSTTGYSPFFLMFGREARLPIAIDHEQLSLEVPAHQQYRQYLQNQSEAFLRAFEMMGETPLHHAAKSGNAEVVNALLKAGSKVDEKDKESIL
eukprot:Em0003g551a